MEMGTVMVERLADRELRAGMNNLLAERLQNA